MPKNLLALFFLCLLALSCGKEEGGVRPDPSLIYLRARVENSIMTRSPYLLTAPDWNNPLKVAVCASTEPNVFDNAGANGSGADNKVALHTSANFTNGTEQLLNDAVYPKDNNTSVYFVGFHPADGWGFPVSNAVDSQNDGKTATLTFNGFEDVMFAPLISGKYGENVDNWPTFSFRHLLTWLRIRLSAESEAVAQAWGRVKSIKIKSPNKVTVDFKNLGSGDANLTDLSKYNIEFSGETELFFYKTGTDSKFIDPADEKTWYSLQFSDDPGDANFLGNEVAYVLCAPVIASEYEEGSTTVRTDEYTILVETEHRTAEVKIDLTKTVADENGNKVITSDFGSTMSHQFILNLKFKMGSNIAVTANVADWVTGGLGSGELDPNVI